MVDYCCPKRWYNTREKNPTHKLYVQVEILGTNIAVTHVKYVEEHLCTYMNTHHLHHQFKTLFPIRWNDDDTLGSSAKSQKEFS